MARQRCRTNRRTTPWQEAAMKAFVMRMHTAQGVTQWCWSGVGNHRRTAAAPNLPKDQKDKSVLIVSRTRCCKLQDRGARAPTASQRPRRAQRRVVVLEVQGRHPGSCKLPQSVSGEDIRDRATAKKPVVIEKYRRNHSRGASGEIRDRTIANELVVKRRERSNTGARTARRTSKRRCARRAALIDEKGRNDEKNREEQSQQQAEEQSQQQAREEHGQQQARQPKVNDRDKAKYDEKHSTEESCSQPVPKHLRSDADVQEGQWEHHKDRLRRGNRGVQEDHPAESPENREGFSQLEADVRWQSAQQAKVAATSRRPWQQPRRISNRENTKTAWRSTMKSIWIDKKLRRSCTQHSSRPRTRSRMSSTVKVGAT